MEGAGFEVEGGGGAEDPFGGIGHARKRDGGRVGLGHCLLDGSDQEHGKVRTEGIEIGLEGGFGAAGFGSERGEIDDDGAVGDFGGDMTAGSDGEKDGAGLVDGIGGLMGDGDVAGGAGGEAAESVGEFGRESGDVIEGEDPVFVGEAVELEGGGRE